MGKAIAIQLILPQLASEFRQAEQVLKNHHKLMLSAKGTSIDGSAPTEYQIPDFFKCCGYLTEIFTLSVLVRYALHTLQLESVRPGL